MLKLLLVGLLTAPLGLAHADGDHDCTSDFGGVPRTLTREMASYFARMNAAASLASLIEPPTLVAKIGEAMVVRTGEELWLVRQVSLDAAGLRSEPLRGKIFVRGERVGDFYQIVTREAAGDANHLHLISDDFDSAKFHRAFVTKDLREFNLPRGLGRAFVLGNFLVAAYTNPAAVEMADGSGRRARLSFFEINGRAETVIFPEGFGDLPILAVDFRSPGNRGSSLILDRTYRDRRVYLDFSGGGQVKRDALVQAQMLIDTPRTASVVPFVSEGATAGQYTANVFVNSPDSRKQTMVTTWNVRRDTGFAKTSLFYTGTRIDFDTLARSRTTPAFLAYAFEGRSTRGNVERRPFEVFMAGAGVDAGNDFPFLLPRTTTALDDRHSGGLLIGSDNRRDQDKVFSSGLAYRYVFLPKEGEQKQAFAFDSTLPLGKVTRQVPVPTENFGASLRGRRFPLAFAEVRGSDNPGYLVINLQAAAVLWVPGLKRVQFVDLGLTDKVLFWGEQRREGKIVPLLAAWNLTENKMEFGTDIRDQRNLAVGMADLTPAPQYAMHALRDKLRHLGLPDNALVSMAKAAAYKPFYKASPIGGWIDPAGVDISYLPKFHSIVASLKRSSGKLFTYLIDVDSFEARIFGGVFKPTVETDANADDLLTVVGEEHQDHIFASEKIDGVPGVPKFWSAPPRKGRATSRRYEYSHVSVIRRESDGTLARQHAMITGQVERLKIIRHGSDHFAQGESRIGGFNRDRRADFTWNLASSAVHEFLIERIEKPLYEDDELKVVATRRSPDVRPKVLIYRRGEIMGDEIVLSRKPDQPENRREVQSLFDFLMDHSGQQTPVVNTQNLVEARREDDLLFITTERTPERASETYVYNLRKEEIVVIIPNYKKHVDLGALRFYIGEADHALPSIVAVFRRQTNTFETFFDFGQIKIDVTSPDAIRMRGQQVVFKTSTGSERVYDTRGKFFLGLVPKDITDRLKDIDGKLGFIWNTNLFSKPIARIFERDDFIRALREAYPLQPGRGVANRLLIVAPEGAGATIAIENFASLYVTGELEAGYRPVFFKLNSTDTNADTSYRGQKADKYRALREAAVSLRSTGYRLIVIIEGVHRMLPQSEHLWSDEEGDFFSAMRDVMEDGEFDVIVTTTPAGRERLLRIKPDFANLLNRDLRMPALSRAATERAVAGYLEHEFPDQRILNPTQVTRVVDRMARLSVAKGLPGVAFDVIKQIVPTDPPAGAKRAKRKVGPAVTDAAIDREIAQRSGVPATLLDRDNAPANADRMREFLNERVRGVPHLVDQFVNDIFAFALEYNRADWPIARIFAVGPTGTGKTELIKAALDFLFGNHDARLLISGEDWSARGLADKLKSLILKHVVSHPFNVLQFDEFEKMHPDNQNVILSLADGEITGPDGKKISTSLTIVYATSNIGVEDVRREIASDAYGFKSGAFNVALLNERLETVYQNALRRELRPEVKNRYDRFLVFPLLSKEIARLIADFYLNGLGGEDTPSLRRRFLLQDLDFFFDESVIDYVAAHFVDLELGGRRLTINLENSIVKDFITNEKLRGRLRAGVAYRVSVEEGQFRLFLK